MRLHGHMRIEVVESTICLFATIPSALVHPLNLFIAPSWPLVLLRAWDRYEGVDGGQRVAALARRNQYTTLA